MLTGHAGEELLGTYEAERRPVDARNVQRSMENGMNHAVSITSCVVVLAARATRDNRVSSCRWRMS